MERPRELAADPGRSIAEPLATEAVALLQRLIRLNTVNPPGDERAAIELLRDLLAGAGFQCELLGAEPGRPNLVARLCAEPARSRSRGSDATRGVRPAGSDRRVGARPAAYEVADGVLASGSARDGGPVLAYLGHVDTVLADAREWRHDPWSGELADGFVWGRGALDMKSQVAAEVTAAVALARSGWRPRRGELLVIAVVDEETGGALGAKWLCEKHPERVRCDLLLNEGGGPHIELGGKRHYPVCCAEKGVFRFTLATSGEAGHASMPRLGKNALLALAPVLERFAAPASELLLTPEPLAFLAAIGEDERDPAGALARLGERDPRLLSMFEPMFAVTFAPTMASASAKINVIPSRAELRVDCRVPPGLGESETRAAIERLLAGIDGVEVRFTEQTVGNRSPIESPLMSALGAWVAENDPGASVVPTVMPGFTDSHHFRAAFPDCVAYGFFPQRHQSLLQTEALMHAPDERIDVRDLALATECYRDLAPRLLGSADR
ncbi:MAG TPA: M20/M25/M40 family metallo-hydrolase [Solirubrobacteraceae bacterium]|nr:M20/M25/M40 family metallo-hydrolase [Solirubrobacteraceae bacterium]